MTPEKFCRRWSVRYRVKRKRRAHLLVALLERVPLLIRIAAFEGQSSESVRLGDLVVKLRAKNGTLQARTGSLATVADERKAATDLITQFLDLRT